MNQTALEKKLTRARTQLILNQPFFGTLCLRLKLVPADVPTMVTNGTRIAYNPSFVDGLTSAELQGALAHEVLHCALGHHCRRRERDPKLWNKAADLAINPIVLKNGLELPDGVLIDPSLDNLSAEEIYARLLRNGSGSPDTTPDTQGKPGNGSGGAGGQQQPSPSNTPTTPSPGNQGSQSPNSSASPSNGSSMPSNGTSGASEPEAHAGSFGEVEDAVDEHGRPASEAERNRQQHEWSIAAEQAARMAKSCGHEPADIQRPLEESRQSAQDWRSILRDFITSTTPSDYRWSPPNRRYISAGLYLPSVQKEGVGELVICVDTSGSIGRAELEQFAGEITAISNEAKPEKIHVVYCDAAVQATQVFEPSEPIDLKPRGGGGTDFRPVFQWVTNNDIAPVCLIYLTDLYCHSYPEIPEYPILWVTDSRRTAPFGETIRITLD